MSNEANILVKNDLINRFSEYYNSSVFSSIKGENTINKVEHIGYAPYFNLAQFFSNKETLNSLLKDKDNKNLYDLFYEEGWINFRNFLDDVDYFDGTLMNIDVQNFEESKKFIGDFIKNNYNPLNQAQYDKIFKKLPA
jgi:hypothetical protein